MVTGRADFGGGPEHVYQLAKSISRSTPVFIACPRDEPYWARYESIVGPERMLELPHRKVAWSPFLRLCRFIRSNHIDIVHAHGRTGGIYARPAAFLAGLRCFYTPNGSTPVCNLRTAIYAAAEYLLSAVTQAVVAVSATEAEALRPLCAFPSRLKVILNGVETPPLLDAPDTRLAHPLPVVHVTRYVFQKNTPLLIDVLAALRDLGHLDRFEFLLLGDGPGRPEFEAALSARGLAHSVKILGAVTNPGSYLAAAWCLISTSRWEGLPIALLEAMARGVPAIATDVTGNKDAVTDHETGFLYDPATPEAAARRLVELAASPVLWKQMVRAARLRAEREFSVEAMAEATLRLYTCDSTAGGVTGVPRTALLRPAAAFPGAIPAGAPT